MPNIYNFVNYDGQNIEPELTGDHTSDGLMSKEDKEKLDNIADGATNYVQPESFPASMITQDATKRFTSDTEKATWNAKASKDNASTTVSGLMSKEDKTKLDAIAANSNNYIHPATHPATMITEDTSHKFVTDAQITTWNAKASSAVATTSVNGLMSKDDKIKLDGIATGANNYTHPTSHPASMITQDTTHKFVTDTQINAWNNKASNLVATTGSNGLMSAADKSKLTYLGTLYAPLNDASKTGVAAGNTVSLGNMVLPPGTFIVNASFQFNISTAGMTVLMIYNTTDAKPVTTIRGVMTGGGGLNATAIVTVTKTTTLTLSVAHTHTAVVNVQNINFKGVRIL